MKWAEIFTCWLYSLCWLYTIVMFLQLSASCSSPYNSLHSLWDSVIMKCKSVKPTSRSTVQYSSLPKSIECRHFMYIHTHSSASINLHEYSTTCMNIQQLAWIFNNFQPVAALPTIPSIHCGTQLLWIVSRSNQQVEVQYSSLPKITECRYYIYALICIPSTCMNIQQLAWIFNNFHEYSTTFMNIQQLAWIFNSSHAYIAIKKLAALSIAEEISMGGF